MLLGNLLEERGFDSLTQFLTAFRGQATSHARQRRLFLSFHQEDKAQVQGFRLMTYNTNVTLDFSDLSVRQAVNSDNSTYVRQVIKQKISNSSVAVCLIGNGTAWRDWVDWELRTAIALGKGICGVRLKDSRGRVPEALKTIGAPVVPWDVDNITTVIEMAAARRA
jgi:hypothetical protein